MRSKCTVDKTGVFYCRLNKCDLLKLKAILSFGSLVRFS